MSAMGGRRRLTEEEIRADERARIRMRVAFAIAGLSSRVGRRAKSGPTSMIFDALFHEVLALAFDAINGLARAQCPAIAPAHERHLWLRPNCPS
jgi:hypothetical protein